MKKVSIFTLIGANNIGAFLQGFALSRILIENGYDYEFVIMPSDNKNSGKIEKIKRYLQYKNLSLLLFKIKSVKKYSEARNILKIVTFKSEHVYEIVVVGSDEVWNIESNTFTQQPQYFGKHLCAKRKISYAPSAGNTSISCIIKLGYDFRSFDYLSVRDQKTFDLVVAIDSRVPARVLDPTFLLSSYDAYIPEINSDGNFILVYSYGVYPVEVEKIKTFAKEIKLPLYSIGTYNKWCNKNVIVSPFEFLAYIKKAKYVITSTFHGTALSIIFNKQFVVFLEDSEKIKSLLSEFEIIDRAVTYDKTITEIINREINYNVLNQKLQQRREESIAYIKNALEGK